MIENTNIVIKLYSSYFEMFKKIISIIKNPVKLNALLYQGLKIYL